MTKKMLPIALGMMLLGVGSSHASRVHESDAQVPRHERPEEIQAPRGERPEDIQAPRGVHTPN